MNNTHQLMVATTLYTVDNSDMFPGNVHGTGITPNHPNRPWAQGWLTWDGRTDNTNLSLLLNEQYSSLAKYFGNQKNVYLCPADNFLSNVQRPYRWTGRARSVSGNVYCGGTQQQIEGGPFDAAYSITPKASMVLKPAMNWMFLDEHPDSINDGYFINKAYYPEWVDLPASYHNGAGMFSFADGHAEVHRWMERGTRQPPKPETLDLPMGVPQGEGRDFFWVIKHMSVGR